jgi:hypothetical protein
MIQEGIPPQLDILGKKNSGLKNLITLMQATHYATGLRLACNSTIDLQACCIMCGSLQFACNSTDIVESSCKDSTCRILATGLQAYLKPVA